MASFIIDLIEFIPWGSVEIAIFNFKLYNLNYPLYDSASRGGNSEVA
jgi:hypothetical protein